MTLQDTTFPDVILLLMCMTLTWTAMTVERITGVLFRIEAGG
jgi:hypothetical protein